MTDDEELARLLALVQAGNEDSKDVARVLAIRGADRVRAGQQLQPDLASWLADFVFAAATGELARVINVPNGRPRGQSEETKLLFDGTSRRARIAAIARLLMMSEWTEDEARELLIGSFADLDVRTITSSVEDSRQLKPTWEPEDGPRAFEDLRALAVGTFFAPDRPPEWTELRKVHELLVARRHAFVETKYFADYFALRDT